MDISIYILTFYVEKLTFPITSASLSRCYPVGVMFRLRCPARLGRGRLARGRGIAALPKTEDAAPAPYKSRTNPVPILDIVRYLTVT